MSKRLTGKTTGGYARANNQLHPSHCLSALSVKQNREKEGYRKSSRREKLMKQINNGPLYTKLQK